MSKKMSAKKYQESTSQFAVFPKPFALEYLALGLASEAGEVAGKASKLIRGDYTMVADAPEGEPQPMSVDLDAFHKDLDKELGDVLWFISELCNLTGLTMEQLMANNIKKLEKRAKENVLKGSGDDR